MTQAFLRRLQQEREEVKEKWARGHYLGDTPEATLQLNIQAVAAGDMLLQIATLIEDMIIPREKADE